MCKNTPEHDVLRTEIDAAIEAIRQTDADLSPYAFAVGPEAMDSCTLTSSKETAMSAFLPHTDPPFPSQDIDPACIISSEEFTRLSQMGMTPEEQRLLQEVKATIHRIRQDGLPVFFPAAIQDTDDTKTS